MIITVTLAPSLDATYEATLVPGEVCRADQFRIEPAGKGVNVSRVLRAAGSPSLAILPVGGPRGAQLTSLMDAEGIHYNAVQAESETRLNTTVTDANVTTKINAPVGDLPASTAMTVLAATIDTMSSAGSAGDDNWLAICGSIPDGQGIELMCDLIRAAKDYGFGCAVDTSGPALAAAAAAGPDLLAPNVEELTALVPASFQLPQTNDFEDLRDLAGRLAVVLDIALLVSLGARGALWTDGDTTVCVTPDSVTVRNTVGAGDALLAGWLAGPEEAEARLTQAVRWGTASCLAAETVPGNLKELVGQVNISAVHLSGPRSKNSPVISTS